MTNGDTILNTDGGTSVGQNVQTDGGAFVGRDQIINVTFNWQTLGSGFIDDLKNTQRLREREKQKELEKKTESRSNSVMQNNVDRLIQKITELEQKITESNHFDWSNAEKVYLTKVLELYNRVRILGSSADVPLGNIFTQVYILDKPTAHQRYNIEELRKSVDERFSFQRQPGERTHGMTLVKRRKNLFILGKPGAGKTTFLKYIATQAAYQNLPQIPIFVSLNEWADSRWGKGPEAALLPFIIEQFRICDFPDPLLFIEYILKQGRAIVLFDGLDEVNQDKNQRRRLIQLLQDFAREYNRSQHLITCRIAASDYAFAGFIDIEVADFTTEQLREYAYKWFGDQEKKYAAFITEIAKSENQGLAELCNTPLLLSLLCLTFDNTMQFPLSRSELYEDALDTLLRKWDSSRQIQRDEIYRELSHKRKLQLLMRIAVPAFERNELFFRQRELEQWIVDYLTTLPAAPSADLLDGTAILKSIEAQHSILVERAQGIYSFSHLTFQEYFTARYIAENQGRGSTEQLIRQHMTDKRWREVFLLTASLLDNADEFIIAIRVAIDKLIADKPTLHELFMWADKRFRPSNMPVEQQYTVQLTFIFLASAIVASSPLTRIPDKDFDLVRVRIRDLVNTFERSQVHEHENAHIYTLALASASALDLSEAHSLNQAQMHIINLARTTYLQVGVDYGLYYTWRYATLFASKQKYQTDKEWKIVMQRLPALVNVVVKVANKAGVSIVAKQLTSLIIPSLDANWHDWQHYASGVFTIMRDQRTLGKGWNFQQEDINKLNDYLYATELLVQCIRVAAITNRQTMLQGLLLAQNPNC